MAQLAIEVASRDDVVLATLSGDIMPADAMAMARRLREIAGLHRRRCVIDLSQLQTVCPQAIDAFVSLQRWVEADGGQLRIASPTPELVARLQKVCGKLSCVFCRSLDEALAA